MPAPPSLPFRAAAPTMFPQWGNTRPAVPSLARFLAAWSIIAVAMITLAALALSNLDRHYARADLLLQEHFAAVARTR